MILAVLVGGFFVGALVNWASDALTRLAAGGRAAAASSPARPGLALPAWLKAAASKKAAGAASRGLALSAGVEVGCALLFGVLWLRLGATAALVLTAGACAFLLLVALIDLKYRLVLNLLIYPAIVVMLALRAASGEISATLVGAGFAFMIFFLTAQLKPGTLGGGDVKLATLLGLAFGFPNILWVLIVGAGAGAVIAVALLLTSGHTIRSIPYAPFLCLGSLVALLYNPLMWQHFGH